jgi:hypothetical protein
MTFGSLDFLIQRCEEHLDKTGMRSTEIESYFVQYLLVRIWAEYETRIATLVHRRCSRSRDKHLRSFAQGQAKIVAKNFKVSDIAGILGRFGEDYKLAFHTQVMSDTRHVAWSNIYTNRMAVAHGVGAQMSFGDLKKDYQESRSLFDALAVALNLKAREMRGLK